MRGPDARFYLFAPVVHAAATTRDRFAIGVAVADAPLGPWVDAHPAGPVVSQSHPVPNDIQNIDPTVFVDDDGRVLLRESVRPAVQSTPVSGGGAPRYI